MQRFQNMKTRKNEIVKLHVFALTCVLLIIRYIQVLFLLNFV